MRAAGFLKLEQSDFHSFSGSFKELRHDKELFDVTLACEDETLEAHKVILQARSSFLSNKDILWQKTQNSDFDITMGSFDGAECCELVGLYMLSCLKHLKINIGVYRDDALGVLKMTSRQAENMKKEICNIFKKHKLSIEIVVNAKIVNFLDITLDLESGIHKPYMKPGNNPIYINQKSNHPPSIIKNIPAAVNRRLSEISSNVITNSGFEPRNDGA